MERTRTRIAVIAALLAWGPTTGCNQPKPDSSTDGGSKPKQEPDEVETQDPETKGTKKAEPEVPPTPTYVALRGLLEPVEVPCPDAGPWRGSPLFDPPPEGAYPLPLQRFCRYTWEGKGVPTEPEIPECVQLAPDPPILLPQAPASQLELLRLAQAELTLDSLGALAGRPRTSPYGARDDGHAYVAIVDTADASPPGSAIVDYSSAPAPQQHGLMMAALVRGVRCPFPATADPGGVCSQKLLHAQAFTEGALPGQRGSLGSLAHAIGVALDTWQAQPDDAQAGLVINLSVAWEPDRDPLVVGIEDALPVDHMSLLDGTNTGVPATVQAVHAAVAWAWCRGALIVAAAGNDRSRVCQEQGPMAPALWERSEAPTPAQCQQYFGDPGAGVAPGTAPLVYAVGGIDRDDQPIPNARLGSTPARVLHGLQAVRPAGSGFTPPWTGTSVPTAALSAIAAQVWSYDPSLTAHEVMARIEDTGSPLPNRTTALHREGIDPPPPVRRIDARAALATTITGPQPSPHATPYLPRSTDDARRATVRSASRAVRTGSTSTSATIDPAALASIAAPTCGGGAVEARATPELRLDPPEQLVAVLDPQPHVPICTTCDVFRTNPGGGVDYEIELAISSAYDPDKVEQPALTLYDPDSGSYLFVELVDAEPFDLVSLGEYPLSTGSLAEWIEDHEAVKTARVSFLVETSGGPQVVTDTVAVIRE